MSTSISHNFIRSFSSTSSVARTGYSTVHPVHHLVKVKKNALKPSFQEFLIPRDDIRAVGYKPKEIDQDRLMDYYHNTLQSDLMLNMYKHDSKKILGSKLRSWGNDSPFKLYRELKKPKGSLNQTRDINPITFKNIPQLESISIQIYNKDALENPWLNISSRLLLSQITNVKAKQISAKANILPWKLRRGKACGAKVELTGLDMSQFITTLVEIVLPRIRTFQGIRLTSGDKNGNITLGLDPEDVKHFPEVEAFQELFPNLDGLHITLKTNARTDERARTLLSSLGFPFYKPRRNS
ncbi:ribosomal protein L5 domain-containing protein [Scheffersomyces amazonensis]|uniref:ribosomal protein L5 domain-containing protein n=1 Tax=Scheffersomyces amazonensis TaxID=1078765 RepID=UPI00315C7C36